MRAVNDINETVVPNRTGRLRVHLHIQYSNCGTRESQN